MLLFAQNLDYLLSSRKVTLQTLAQYVGVTHSSIGNWRNGAKFPDIKALVMICKFFSIDPGDILLKDLTTGIDPKELEAVLPGDISGSNILVSEEAQTGYVADWTGDFIQKKLKYVNIPEVEGEARTFEVYGNSMTPILMDGDYVVCKPSSLAEIKPGQIYAIAIKPSLTDAHPVKITHAQLERGRVLCVPANGKEFKSHHIEEHEVKEVWVAEMRLTKNMSDPQKTWDVEQRLAIIEDWLQAKFSDEVLK